MRKVAAIGIAAIATLAFATTAEAKTSTTVRPYNDVEFSDTGFHVAFGQVFSNKQSCAANRKVKLVAVKGGKSKVVGSGVSTDEGAISGGYLKSRVGNAQIRLVAPKTKKCGADSAVVEADPNPPVTRRANETLPAVLDVDGKGNDGAFAGLILLQQPLKGQRGSAPPRQCFVGRKISLYGDGEQLDHGVTSNRGTFALHVTNSEFNTVSQFKIKVRKSKAPDGTECGAGETTFPEPF